MTGSGVRRIVTGLLLGGLLGVPALIVWETSPSSRPDAAVSGAPVASPAAHETCAATITRAGGLPGRPARCADPSYFLPPIPSSPALDRTETSTIRTIRGAQLSIDRGADPVHYAPPGTPLRPVRCHTHACAGGTTAPVTGEEWVAPGDDGRTIVVDTHRRRSYEFYQVDRDTDGTVRLDSDGAVPVGAMSVVDLDGRGNRTPDGENLNVTGAGVSLLPGVIRAHEVEAAAVDPRNAIPHALRVALPASDTCADRFREPARKTSGRSREPGCVVLGARIQLDPRFNCSTLPRMISQAVCYTLQKYGAYTADAAGTWMMFYGQHRRSWATADRDYAAVGIDADYSHLELPIDRLRVLATWDGERRTQPDTPAPRPSAGG